jgi:WD40 repeat protein/nucleoside phosphorylase
VAGVLSVEDALKAAATEAPEEGRKTARDLYRAIQAGSHQLRVEPKRMASQVYNWLRCSGWTAERLEAELRPIEALPVLRLRHPVRTGGSERTFAGHGEKVFGCTVTLDGRRVVSASEDGTLKVWDLETGEELATLEGHGAMVIGCAVTPDGRRVVSASWDNTLKVWDLETGRELATLKGHGDSVNGCAVTPDGRRAVSASRDNTLKVWDLETGYELATLKGHGASVNACEVTLDGRRVVSASGDKTLKVWDLETGQELATLKGQGAWVTDCAVTPDGRRVVSASWDNTLKVWDLETGQELATLEGHGANATGCAVTPDGRRVVSASDDWTLKVWDLETGQELAALEDGRGANATGCAVTPDGRRVVSASDNWTLKVWDLEMGRKLATLKGHELWVNGFTVTPDGRRVVSASGDNTLKVWDLETGQCLTTLYGFSEFTAVSVGAELICAGDQAGNVWILEMGTSADRSPSNGKGRHETEGIGSASMITSMVSSKSSQAGIDLGILIALQEEFREFLALLPVKPSAERDSETGQHSYTFEHPVTHHRCVATLIGEMNPGPAALQTERLLTRWSPRTLVMLGIAAGIHSDVRVGDVVIASQVDNYFDSAKAQPGSTPEAFEFSLGGRVYQADFDFLTQVRNFEFVQPQAFTRWHQACVQELAELVPKEKVRTALVEKGLVRGTPGMLDAHLASGPVVGAAQQFTKWLRNRDRNLKALDMESAGLMDAAMKRVEPARTLVIRGISDYGDERKKQLDQVGEGALRRYAMRNATRLLLQLLETRVLPGLAGPVGGSP